jgi:betaine-aldehyde dehydrogenase
MTSRTTTSSPVIDKDAHLIHVYRPADGTHLADVKSHTAADVAARAKQLRNAQTGWEQLGVRRRAEWINRYRQWILDNTDRLLKICAEEGGRPINEPMLETTLLVEVIDYYSRTAPKLLAPKRLRPHSLLVAGKKLVEHRHPHPLVGVIGAWNFPLLLTVGDALPALFAGSAVLLKSSELTPIGVRALVEGWSEIGAPPVLDVVDGDGNVGAALVGAVDFIQFTGSVDTGRKVAHQAADRLIPASLELGGKDSCLVLSGANLARAARCAVYGGFANNGQVCMGFERVYVQDDVYDEFVSRVLDSVQRLRCGVDDNSDVGAFTSPAQIDIVAAHVEDAVAKGARIVTGGHRVDRAGNWFEPTVLVDVDHTMTVMRDETFGPVLPIMRVSDAEEAIRLSNDTDFGLSASIFAATTEQAERIASRLEVGAVNINDFLINMTCAEAPQGGWKQSGIGSRAGTYGLLKFTRTKVVAENRVGFSDNEINWFPYTPTRRRIFRTAVQLVQRRGLDRIGWLLPHNRGKEH